MILRFGPSSKCVEDVWGSWGEIMSRRHPFRRNPGLVSFNIWEIISAGQNKNCIDDLANVLDVIAVDIFCICFPSFCWPEGNFPLLLQSFSPITFNTFWGEEIIFGPLRACWADVWNDSLWIECLLEHNNLTFIVACLFFFTNGPRVQSTSQLVTFLMWAWLTSLKREEKCFFFC